MPLILLPQVILHRTTVWKGNSFCLYASFAQ